MATNSRSREEEKQGVGERGRESLKEGGRSSSSKEKRKEKKNKTISAFLLLFLVLLAAHRDYRHNAPRKHGKSSARHSCVHNQSTRQCSCEIEGTNPEPRDEPTPRPRASRDGRTDDSGVWTLSQPVATRMTADKRRPLASPSSLHHPSIIEQPSRHTRNGVARATNRSSRRNERRWCTAALH